MADRWEEAAQRFKGGGASATTATPAAPKNEDWKVWQQTGGAPTSEQPSAMSRFGTRFLEGINPANWVKSLGAIPSVDPMAGLFGGNPVNPGAGGNANSMGEAVRQTVPGAQDISEGNYAGAAGTGASMLALGGAAKIAPKLRGLPAKIPPAVYERGGQAAGAIAGMKTAGWPGGWVGKDLGGAVGRWISDKAHGPTPEAPAPPPPPPGTWTGGPEAIRPLARPSSGGLPNTANGPVFRGGTSGAAEPTPPTAKPTRSFESDPTFSQLSPEHQAAIRAQMQPGEKIGLPGKRAAVPVVQPQAPAAAPAPEAPVPVAAEPPRPLARPAASQGLPKQSPLDAAKALNQEMFGTTEKVTLPPGDTPGENPWPKPEVFAEAQRPFKAMNLAQPLHEAGLQWSDVANATPEQMKPFVRAIGQNNTGDISPMTIKMVAEEMKRLQTPKAAPAPELPPGFKAVKPRETPNTPTMDTLKGQWKDDALKEAGQVKKSPAKGKKSK